MKLKKSRWIVCLFMMVGSLLLYNSIPVSAAGQDNLNREKVRVGYLLYNYYQEGAEGEPKSGYGYEYLQKIASYTGWEYEYVYGTFSELLEGVKNGSIDIMGDISITDERYQVLDFGQYPQGEEHYLLVTQLSDSRIQKEDFSTIEGKRIGVAKGTIQIELLREWLTEHRFEKVQVIEFENSEERLKALATRKIDATLIPDGTQIDEWQKITTVGTSNYYFVTNKQKPWLKKELDKAQEQILENNPNYNQELVDRYVNYMVEEKTLSQEEKEWIQEKAELRIGYLKDSRPYSYVDEDGQMQGMYRYLFDRLEERYSVPCVYKGYDDYREIIHDLKEQKIDIIVPLVDIPWSAENDEISLTTSITTVQIMQVTRKDNVSDLKKIAIGQNSSIQPYYALFNHPDCEYVWTDSIEESISDVRDGIADCTYFLDNSIVEIIGKEMDFSSMVLNDIQASARLTIGTRVQDKQLISILNKLISNIQPSEINKSIIANARTDTREVSVKDFILKHKILVNVLVLSVFTVVITLLVYLIMVKKKSKMVLEYLHQATHDALTGLYNRLAFDNATDEMKGKPAANGITFMIIDIDFFKNVNDTYGHATGDMVIKGLADIIQNNFSQAEMVCRWGGEEFIVLLHTNENVYEMAEKLRKEVETHLFGEPGEGLHITISIGIASTAKNEIPYFSQLFERADEKLYEAKNNGRNLVLM